MNKTIKMTERELEIVFDALQLRLDTLNTQRPIPRVVSKIAEVEELIFDLMEQDARHDDDWGRENDAVPDAALDMIQAGIDAREEVKAASRAAQRREQALSDRLMGGTTDTLANDPIDW